jgi:protein-L-isoaspartate(D-aspartate) O-methyltransferase
MSDFDIARKSMVDCQIRPADVTRYNIIEAMLAVPREYYVPKDLKDIAYCGDHIKLSPKRSLLDPRILAKMLDLINIQKDELVLDIGAGLGYSSALISRMAEAVVSVEDAGFAEQAELILSKQSADNVFIHQGNLKDGAKKFGPYDALIIQGGVEVLPQRLIDQVKIGGRLVAIFMNNSLGECKLGLKNKSDVDWIFAFNATANLLDGFQQEAGFTF